MRNTITLRRLPHLGAAMTALVSTVALAGLVAVIYVSAQPRVATESNVVSAVVPNAGASDWFERHPSAISANLAVGASDWFERHPETIKANYAAGASDWFERHPSIGK